MGTKSKLPKEFGGALSSLSTAINTLDLAGRATSVEPAKNAFGSANLLLTTIRVCSFPAQSLLISD